jgi:protein gp37
VGEHSHIEWTDATWNPWQGCTKVSPGARPMRAEWVRTLRDQCQEVGVAFHFKQWGGARPGGERLLDGREWNEFPVREAVLA